MKTSLFSTTIVLCFLVSSILCQEEDGSDDSLMTRFKNLMKNFWNSMKDMWSEFKQEVKARTGDMRDWSKEMFESFKENMKKWINQAGASDSEKEDMRKYIERMQMEMEKEDK